MKMDYGLILKRVLSGIFTSIVLFLLLMVLLAIFPSMDFFEVPAALLTGWWSYLHGVISRWSWNWDALGMGVVLLMLGVGGFHAVIKSITRGNDPAWKFKYTFCISVMLLMIFSISLAVGGIAHQAAWLARSDSWFYDSSRGQITKCISNAKQLITYLKLYAADHYGKYPEYLDDLVSAGLIEPDTFERLTWNQWQPGGPIEKWIYIRGLKDDDSGSLPVIIAPQRSLNRGQIIATDDGSVSLIKDAEIMKQIPVWRAEFAKRNVAFPVILEGNRSNAK